MAHSIVECPSHRVSGCAARKLRHPVAYVLHSRGAAGAGASGTRCIADNSTIVSVRTFPTLTSIDGYVRVPAGLARTDAHRVHRAERDEGGPSAAVQ